MLRNKLISLTTSIVIVFLFVIAPVMSHAAAYDHQTLWDMMASSDTTYSINPEKTVVVAKAKDGTTYTFNYDDKGMAIKQSPNWDPSINQSSICTSPNLCFLLVGNSQYPNNRYFVEYYNENFTMSNDSGAVGTMTTKVLEGPRGLSGKSVTDARTDIPSTTATPPIEPPIHASHFNLNGIIKQAGSIWSFSYTNFLGSQGTVSLTIPNKSYTSGSTYNCTGAGDYGLTTGILYSYTSIACTAGAKGTATNGVGSVNDPGVSPPVTPVEPATGPDTIIFKLFPGYSCPASEALTCWVSKVFIWSQGGILVLATAVIIIAGIIYMTSAGNPKQIALSKRLILGALSGVAVMVLGRFFLTVVIGIQLPWL